MIDIATILGFLGEIGNYLYIAFLYLVGFAIGMIWLTVLLMLLVGLIMAPFRIYRYLRKGAVVMKYLDKKIDEMEKEIDDDYGHRKY